MMALALRLDGLLDEKGRSAVLGMLTYFTEPNLPKMIRNKFAFHYDAAEIMEQLNDSLANADRQSFVTSNRSGNIFYTFAENVRNVAIARSINKDDPGAAVRRLHDELGPVHDRFDCFSRSLLRAIASKCDMTMAEEFDSEQVVDLNTIGPVVFSDEDAMLSLLRERGHQVS